MEKIDIFGFFYGNARRLNTVLPPFPHHSSTAGPPALVDEEFSSIVQGIHGLCSLGTYNPSARPPIDSKTFSPGIGSRGLSSAANCCTPSDKLLVLQIIRRNEQLRTSSTAIPPVRWWAKSLPCGPVTASPTLGHVLLRSRIPSEDLHGGTSALKPSKSMAVGVSLTACHQVNDDDVVNDHEEDWEDCSESSTPAVPSAEDNSQVEEVNEDEESDAPVGRNASGRQLHLRGLPCKQGYRVFHGTMGADNEEPEKPGKATDLVEEDSDPKAIPASLVDSKPSRISDGEACQLGIDANAQKSPPTLRHPLEGGSNYGLKGYHEQLTGSSQSESSIDPGPWVIGMGQNGIEAYAISPIPFDIHQPQNSLDTPSSESEGSEPDITSPLFEKSCAATKKKIPCGEPPLILQTGGAGKGVTNKALAKVWHDDSTVFDFAGKPKSVGQTGAILKDVSNTRRPLGALQRTSIGQSSIAQEKEVNRIRDYHQRFRCLKTTVAPIQHCSALPYIQHPKGLVDQDVSAWNPAGDARRAIHFAAALDSLEGRTVLRRTPNPLVRCADEYYEEDVMVENAMPKLVHPQPIRVLNVGVMVEKMEKQVAEMENEFPELVHPQPVRVLNVELIVAEMEKQVVGGMWDH